MLAVAANHGMGMALIPQMLIKTELQKKELVMVSTKKLEKKRAYYLIHSSQENSPLIEKFVGWMQQEVKD